MLLDAFKFNLLTLVFSLHFSVVYTRTRPTLLGRRTWLPAETGVKRRYMAQEINKQFKTMSGVTKLVNFVERDSYLHCSWNNKDKVNMLFLLPVHLFQNYTHFIRLILIITSPLYNLECHVMYR
jgi:hypothetical protein